MSRQDPDDEDAQPLALAHRPPAYPMEEALEANLAPEYTTLPQDQDQREPDPWDEPEKPRYHYQPGQAKPGAATQPGDQQGSQSNATGGSDRATKAGNRREQQGNREQATAPATGALATAQVIGVHPPESETSPALPAARALQSDQPPVTETDAPPVTVAEALASLPQWQARYALTLMEVGGVVGLACTKTSISRQSVEKARRNNPAFDAACAAAIEHSTDLTEAATWRSATIGNLRAKYHQGFIVGYERVLDTKAAELVFKLRGKIDDGSGGKGNSASVTLVQVTSADTVAAVVSDAMARIYQARATSGRVLPASGDK